MDLTIKNSQDFIEEQTIDQQRDKVLQINKMEDEEGDIEIENFEVEGEEKKEEEIFVNPKLDKTKSRLKKQREKEKLKETKKQARELKKKQKEEQKKNKPRGKRGRPPKKKQFIIEEEEDGEDSEEYIRIIKKKPVKKKPVKKRELTSEERISNLKEEDVEKLFKIFQNETRKHQQKNQIKKQVPKKPVYNRVDIREMYKPSYYNQIKNPF